jgi:tetratricopeptide (TPR) repeat protein
MPARRLSGWLRPEPSKFLGRASELARVDAALTARKVVAIVGPSGIGKTRLVLRYGITRGERFAGVWFCDASAARDVEELTAIVRRRVAPASPPSLTGEAAQIALQRALGARAGALVIVDDVNHEMPGAIDAIRAWVACAPEVRFVIASQAPLGIGEQVVELGALELPTAGSVSSDAVDLFVARVRTHRGTFDPGAHELSQIADVVQSLGGVPLAIELAAARFDDDDVFTPEAATRSARGAIHRAFAGLSPTEQDVLAQVSVFRGSFGVPAIEAVVDAGDARAIDVVATLARKSLLEVERHEPLRFRMGESIRSYAAGREAEAVALKHQSYFAIRARAIASDAPPSDADADRADLEAAMERAARTGASLAVLWIALALDTISAGVGLGRAALAHLDTALAAGAARDLGLVGRVLGVRAASMYGTGRLAEALNDAEMALRLATELSDRAQMAAMSKRAGEIAFQLGELDRSSEHLERALAIETERGDDRALAAVHYLIASLHQSRGDRQRARIEYGVSLALAKRVRDAAGEARAEMGLAWEHVELGDHAGARERYERAIDLAHPLGLERTVRIATGYLGISCFDAGALGEAEEHLRRAAYACRRAGDPRVEGVFEGVRGAVLATMGRLAEARRSFDLAEQLLVGNAFYGDVIAIHRGHLDLADATRAAKHGDLLEAELLFAAARARITKARAPGANGETFVARSDDARLAVRILERTLGQQG